MGLNSGSVYVESNTSLWKKLDEFHDHEPCVPDPLLQSFILPENNIQILYNVVNINLHSVIGRCQWSVRVQTYGRRLTAYFVQNGAQFWKCL